MSLEQIQFTRKISKYANKKTKNKYDVIQNLDDFYSDDEANFKPRVIHRDRISIK